MSSSRDVGRGGAEVDGRVRRAFVVDGIGWIVEGPGDTTLADVVRVLGGDPDRCDGRLDAVLAGTAVAGATGGPERSPAVGWLSVVSGPDAGQRVPLTDSSSLTIGRRPGAASSPFGTSPTATIDDPAVSARQCVIEAVDGSVVVRDCGSTNGTFVDGFSVGPAGTGLDDGSVLSIGRSVLRWMRTETQLPHPQPFDDRRGDGFALADGTVPVRRPPLVREAPPTPIAVPTSSAKNTARLRVRPASIVGPLVGGLALALLINPKLAVLALLSPVLMVLNLVDDRRAAARERRTGERSFAEAMTRFIDELDGFGAAEAQRRRLLHVDLATVHERVLGASAGLWTRRSETGWTVRIGVGDVAWRPPLSRPAPYPPAVDAALVSAVLANVPVTVDLSDGRCVTVVGHRSSSVLRALMVQVAAGFGPSVLTIVVLGDASSVPEWVRWLPHHQGMDAVLASPGQPGRHVIALQFDGAGDGAATARQRFRSGVESCSFIVAVESSADAPTETTVVVDVTARLGDVLVDLLDGGRRHHVVVDGVSELTALSMARAMARWRDPNDGRVTDSLPEQVSIRDLVGWPTGLGEPPPWPDTVRRSELAVPLGIGPSGLRWVDFVADGPHALVAGTTGAGKSELLRTLVTAMALQYSPDEVTFVLVDYKGGSAFAECVESPHTVGLVTDLDDGLASRALTCLEAELRHREQVLRDTGARDLLTYDGSLGPLPRLVVVIDELAALIRDLPTFVGALVSLAQRGRSLGLHLVLATQRPAGTINDAIRANTNLRIALRVQDGADSIDVIGQPGAAELDRRIPGRALIRLGPGEVSPLQVASVAVPATRGLLRAVRVDGRESLLFSVDDGRLRAANPPDAAGDSGNGEDTSSLGSLARRLRSFADDTGRGSPRPPWPPPLPRSVDWRAPGAAVPVDGAVGFVDVPTEQRQYRFVPDFGRGGIGIIGALGRGVSSTLHTVVVATAAAYGPDRVHVFVVELVGRDLEGLAALPHVGAVVGPHEEERRDRLLAMLERDVARRRSSGRTANGPGNPVGEPRVLLVVDGWSAVRAGGADVALAAVGDRLQRLASAGANVGLRLVVGTDRATSLTSNLAPLLAHRWVLSPADHQEAAAAGVRFSPSATGVAGRAVVAATVATELQVFRTSPADVAAVAEQWSGRGVIRSASTVGVLPTALSLAELVEWPVDPDGDVPHEPPGLGDAWRVPLGLRSTSLSQAALVLRAGEPTLVTGPPRSGRTTTLRTIAASARRSLPGVWVVCLIATGQPVGGEGPWGLPDCAMTEHTADAVAAVRGLLAESRRVLFLVDDADRIDDPAGELGRLLTDRSAGLRIVVSSRADVVRTAYGHWVAAARRTRQGVALRPNVDVDGEVWQTPFPRRLAIGTQPGAAVLVADGAVDVVQVAYPGDLPAEN